mmetsp:Transcript_21127/g.58766  ORF Transcript_21127/g.58766 Transcript_21127/m.58766 type:complete len:98 (-) Transcript_21127:69-362(-)
MPPATEADVNDDNTVDAPTSPCGRPATEPSPSQTRDTTDNLSTHFDQYCARALLLNCNQNSVMVGTPLNPNTLYMHDTCRKRKQELIFYWVYITRIS